MTFPDQKFTDIGAFADAYFQASQVAQASVDRVALAKAGALLAGAYAARKTIYVCGNGGSAAISNHLVCDHLKCIQTDTDLRPRVVSLSATIETITAVANDISYDEVFVYQLRTLADPGDVLISVSSSGDSENVVRACDWAKANDLAVIAMTGFAGGRTQGLADVNLHVAGDNYGVVEDTHQALMHILAQFIRQDHMTAEVIRDRKF
ncbi:MAG: phosphoheptose isomerase [Rhodospirillaceae bacterium]|nr:phosphoheptose isomerase [Magnetovibrio sp.]MAY67145.1 phosphoheptose isomerase [Rhodospirillaceae bacterium]|tara:strand:+ start:130 stop:750 length:621 start_codon:yes stop_codon:yes gene_type:complete